MRDIDLLVISDIHLGTYGCHAKELLKYLKSINPKRVVLNGDIIDIWQFKKRYWPQSHMQVIKHILNWITEGVKVDYVTGNHDELLRKFVGFSMGSFRIKNKVLLDLNGKKTWIFHGDVFDVTMKYSKWLCKLGAVGYDTLIAVNSFVNFILLKFGRNRISLSKKVKNGVKKAIKFIDDFEMTAAEIGIDNGYQNVVCGHIHQPKQKVVRKGGKQINYLNSGDWIENCTALEYTDGNWRLYEYFNDTQLHKVDYELIRLEDLSSDELFNQMLREFSNTDESEKIMEEIEALLD
ncbi:UDP-2,3-diacylglucosamine diphosphatase [bacterium]|nr:UDP-2,3-diacylglucosamine diphosphatase [bacterium]